MKFFLFDCHLFSAGLVSGFLLCCHLDCCKCCKPCCPCVKPYCPKEKEKPCCPKPAAPDDDEQEDEDCK